MRAKFFKDCKSDCDFVHAEWNIFFNNLSNRLNSKKIKLEKNNKANKMGEELLNFITRYTSTTNNSDLDNMVFLILSEISDLKPSSKENDTINFDAGLNIYNALFEITTSVSQSGLACVYSVGPDSTVTSFNYNYDTFIQAMLAAAVAKAKPVGAVSSFFDEPEKQENTYYRKADGTLCTLDKDGKEVDITTGSDEHKKLVVKDNKCFTTGFSDAAKCSEYFEKCLLGKGIEKCKSFLQVKSYWTDIQKEVDEMVPDVAVHTLEAFKFGKEEVYDEVAKRNLRKFKSVEKWLESLQKLVPSSGSDPLSDAEYTAIAKNDKLLGYLAMVVKKVNSNADILNGYSGKTEESLPYSPNQFVGTRLYKMGIKPYYSSNNCMSDICRIEALIKQNILQQRNMLGGGTLTNKLEGLPPHKQTWSILENAYKNLVQSLGRNGKKIQDDDAKKINELINSLKNNEIKLYKAIIYVDKYSDLLNIHGHQDNTDVLSFDHLKKFVEAREKYLTRTSKQQYDLISIIKTIADVASQSKNGATATKTDPVDVNYSFVSLLKQK